VVRCARRAHTTTGSDIVLTTDERTTLKCLARGGRTRADLAWRARIILGLADGASYLDIQRGLGESSRTIGKWKRRFVTDRVAGLQGRYPGAVTTVLTPILEARILAWTRKPNSRHSIAPSGAVSE
jgi:Homeodomain-like domain